MIPARKNALFNLGLRPFLGWTLRRRFHNIYVAGQEHLRALPAGGPVVGCVNHSNWWDGFVLYVLSHRLLPHEIYLAMEEKNLGNYRFFAWMGVFGLNLTGGRSALPGLRYALRLLRAPGGSAPPLIWMFGQGRLLPVEAALEVKAGACFLARHSGAALLPLVLRYEWLSESRPSIFVGIGRPLPPAASGADLASAMSYLLAEVPTAAGDPRMGNYQPLFGPRMSLNKRWDYLRRGWRTPGGQFERQNR